jgi:ATP-dependent helicase HepA
VPCFAGTVSEILLDFHNRVLDIFSQPNPVAAQVELETRALMDAVFAAPGDEALVSQLHEAGMAANRRLLDLHAAGRDRLLELNSCRPAQAQAILEAIRSLEQQAHPGGFLQMAFENFGLDCEENANGTWNVRLTDDMLLESFPLVPDDGMTFTLDRKQALARDDLPFVNWLHHLVLQTLDLILQQNNGKAFAGILRDKRLPQGTLLLESTYRVTVSAPPALQASRWFPATTLRSVVDSQKRSIGKSLTAEQIDARSEVLDRAHLRPLLIDRKPLIQSLANLGKKVVEKQLPDLIESSTNRMVDEVTREIARLQALQKVNPQVDPGEIGYLEQQQTQLQEWYARASIQLESLRLLLAV